MRTFGWLVLWCLASAGWAPGQSQDAPGLVVEHGTYAIRLLGRRVGTEDYTVRENASSTNLKTVWEESDRGAALNGTTTLALGPGYVPQRLEQTGGPGETRLLIDGASAVLTTSGGSRTIPARGVAVFDATPAAVQMMVMRYWLAHGRPVKLPVMNGSGTPLEIREVGHEAIYVQKNGAKGKTVRLSRFTVEGLVFGREIVWMNDSGRLAALMTFAGGLPREEVLDEYESVTGDLVHSAVQQELLDLAALGRQVKPVVQGAYAISGVRLVDGRGGPAVEGATVVVRDGRVAAVGTGGAPAGMRVVRADGDTLLPGYWALDIHFSGVEDGPALLAQGVTTARDCGGELEFLVSARRAIERDHALGPRLLLAGLISGGGPAGFGAVRADTPAAGVQAVDLYAEQKFEQIRLYGPMRPEVVTAIRAEAVLRGLGMVEDNAPCTDGPLAVRVRTGLEPMAAIQSVTSDAAAAMKLESDAGTIEVGKRADLVLVRGDPLQAIDALRAVDRVVKGGVMWDAAALARSVGLPPP